MVAGPDYYDYYWEREKGLHDWLTSINKASFRFVKFASTNSFFSGHRSPSKLEVERKERTIFFFWPRWSVNYTKGPTVPGHVDDAKVHPTLAVRHIAKFLCRPTEPKGQLTIKKSDKNIYTHTHQYKLHTVPDILFFFCCCCWETWASSTYSIGWLVSYTIVPAKKLTGRSAGLRLKEWGWKRGQKTTIRKPTSTCCVIDRLLYIFLASHH